MSSTIFSQHKISKRMQIFECQGELAGTDPECLKLLFDIQHLDSLATSKFGVLNITHIALLSPNAPKHVAKDLTPKTTVR